MEGDDFEMPIPRFPTPWKPAYLTSEDARIWTGRWPVRHWKSEKEDRYDAAIMLAFTELQGIKPAMKRLALFLRHCDDT